MGFLQQGMCQRFALSLRASNQALRIRRKRRDPIVGSDLLTWMRPNRRCRIGATHTLFNDRVRPVPAVRVSAKQPQESARADFRCTIVLLLARLARLARPLRAGRRPSRA
jgi:hypothetical protein